MNDQDQGTIATYTGRRVAPTALRAEDVAIEDVAHALALQCRFSGHVREPYSVAEHSVRVSRLVEAGTMNAGADLLLAALLHDAAEAYLVDLPRPVKRMEGAGFYRDAERRAMAVILRRFGLAEGAAEAPIIRDADMILCATEARDLMPRGPAFAPFRYATDCEPLAERIEPWGWVRAEREFLSRFYWLDASRRGR